MHHLFAAFILTLLFIPTIAFGAGLIPCGGAGEKECIACDFIKLGSNIINFLITIGAGIAVVLIAVAGLRMVMARGNMGEIEKAKASIEVVFDRNAALIKEASECNSPIRLLQYCKQFKELESQLKGLQVPNDMVREIENLQKNILDNYTKSSAWAMSNTRIEAK